MSNLVNHVLMNKLDDELNKAINEVGGDTSGATGPWDYPAIIKEQLEAKGSGGAGEISMDLKAGPGIIIKEFQGQKFICSTSGALTTGALNPPSGSYKQPVSEVIEAGTPVQEVFEALFYKILPKISSVYKGDIIIAGEDGSDKYNEEDLRTGLIPSAHYLRIYVANRQEPVYICLSGHGIVNSEGGNGSIITPPSQTIKYKGGESEYISVSVVGDTITATLNQAGVDLFNKIISIEQITNNLDGAVKTLNDNYKNLSADLDTLRSEVSNIDIEKIQEAINTIGEMKGSIDEIRGELDSIDLDGIKELKGQVDATIEMVNTLSGQLGKVDELEGKVNDFESALEDLNLSNIQDTLDSLKSSSESLTSRMNVIEPLVEAKANKSDVNAMADNFNETISLLQPKINQAITDSSKASNDASTAIETVTEVKNNYNEVKEQLKIVQDNAVTQQQVETVVENTVEEKINNVFQSEVVDGKVREQILEALTDENDNDIKSAFENVVSDVLSDSTTETSGMIDDIFSEI